MQIYVNKINFVYINLHIYIYIYIYISYEVFCFYGCFVYHIISYSFGSGFNHCIYGCVFRVLLLNFVNYISLCLCVRIVMFL